MNNPVIVALSKDKKIHSVGYWILKYTSKGLFENTVTNYSMIFINNTNKSQRDAISFNWKREGFTNISWEKVSGAKLNAHLQE